MPYNFRCARSGLHSPDAGKSWGSTALKPYTKEASSQCAGICQGGAGVAGPGQHHSGVRERRWDNVGGHAYGQGRPPPAAADQPHRHGCLPLCPGCVNVLAMCAPPTGPLLSTNSSLVERATCHECRWHAPSTASTGERTTESSWHPFCSQWVMPDLHYEKSGGYKALVLVRGLTPNVV